MNNLYDLINIIDINKEDAIKTAINNVKNQLRDLTEERTCIIFSRYISSELNKMHVLNKIISTKEKGYSYNHEFVTVLIDKYNLYVIDLTYEQFDDDLFPELVETGYVKMNMEEYKRYIDTVGAPDILFKSSGEMKVK